MLLSPKWQTMRVESQNCTKNVVNAPLPSQQASKILDELRTSCSSPNKSVQLEALKCWGNWINSQKPEDWKLNSLCYTAVRPLVLKKLQPLLKDVDVCKVKLSLMWALLVKVQDMMHLEGPQNILEVFLQSCLTWLSSTNGDGPENEVSLLIFQLILAIFKKDENLIICDKEQFPALSTEILQLKKVFHRLADKFLNIFLYWRKVQDKALILKIWSYFLVHCEHSCEYIPIPVWHKVFKLASQICSEKTEPIKERLAFLHSSATNLKSVLSSSKFIDYGNLLTTPCEALLKILVELCSIESEEFCDAEMFSHSRETCQVLLEESVAIGGFDLCIFVLDSLEEFSLRSLYWGVWCGLVHCYETHLMGVDTRKYTKIQTKFYRKLRGVAINFELDKNYLHKDCIPEVQKHIDVLKIRFPCSSCASTKGNIKSEDGGREVMEVDPREDSSGKMVAVAPRKNIFGKFSVVPVHRTPKHKTISVRLDLIKDIFKVLDVETTKSLLGGMFNFRFISPIGRQVSSKNVCLKLSVSVESEKEINVTVSCAKEKKTSPKSPVRKGAIVPYKTSKVKTEEEEEVVSTPKTRSRRRAEEEEMKKEAESSKRKKRKSFEVIVQEIVRKNKLRKTEKNERTVRKSPVLSSKKERKTKKRNEEKAEPSKSKKKSKKEEKTKKEKTKPGKNKPDGKLENYFKVITKKPESEAKKTVEKEESKPKKGKKSKKKKKTKERTTCCNEEEESEKKGEIAWKQTSLKTMMNQNKKEKTKQRNNRTPEKKEKTKEKTITNLSPFKEVFHDHEYTKIELPDLKTLERVLEKPKETVEIAETPVKKFTEIGEETEKKTEKPLQEEVFKTDVETEEILERKGKKRIRILDSLKPSKKIKLEEEDPPEDKLEVIEKENLEEVASPTKEGLGEKTGSCFGKGSPKMISSRALRMIALLPESTKGSQPHREAQPKVEVLKCKKPPNVDKNSRASKMLALLSENGINQKIVEPEETSPIKTEEPISAGGLVTTPTPKTPVSTLKSPKSVKKRKSIRFDDAKNETVLYQTDTPPSQILEEKEKCRRNRPPSSNFLLELNRT